MSEHHISILWFCNIDARHHTLCYRMYVTYMYGAFPTDQTITVCGSSIWRLTCGNSIVDTWILPDVEDKGVLAKKNTATWTILYGCDSDWAVLWWDGYCLSMSCTPVIWNVGVCIGKMSQNMEFCDPFYKVVSLSWIYMLILRNVHWSSVSLISLMNKNNVLYVWLFNKCSTFGFSYSYGHYVCLFL